MKGDILENEMASQKFSTLLLFSIVLSGCVDQEFYVRQGVSLDLYQRDTVSCATTATQAVPTNTQMGWAPYVGVYSVDTNVALRTANLDICLRDRGYQKVTIPYCADGNLQAATAAAALPNDPSRRMNIRADSCYINTVSGPSFFNAS